MTREQMVAEFGETGVQNPAVIDLLTTDRADDAVVLVMIERRPWNAVPVQLRQMEEKINRYLGYVLDGFMAQHYPQYEGKPVRIRLDCVEAPRGEVVRFVEAATHAVRASGLEFMVNVAPAA